MKGRRLRQHSGAALSDRYQILGLAGRGAFSEVFHVRDRLLGRDLALKRFRLAAAEPVERMLADEFVLLSQLDHPHLPRVFDFAVDGEGRPFFTMDYLAGPSLQQIPALWKRTPRSQGRRNSPLLSFVASAAGRVLSALSFIHARGITHGDVKPSNVLFARGRGALPPDSQLKLVDFGLGGALSRLSGHSARGTPRYMAPEIARGGASDPVSDLFSLGRVLEELLAAVRRRGEASGGLAEGLAAIARRLVAPSRGLRYRNADEAFGDLLGLLAAKGARSASGLRRIFVFSGRPSSWDRSAAAIERRLEAARSGRGGVVVAAGLGGRAAERVVAELRAKAMATGMGAIRVPLAVGSGADPIGSALAAAATVVLAAAGRSIRDGRGRSMPAPAPHAALASRLVEASGVVGSAGAVWLLEGAERLRDAELLPLGHLALALRRSRVLVAALGAPAIEAAALPGVEPDEIVAFPGLGLADVEETLGASFGEVEPRGSLSRLLHERTSGDIEALGLIVERLVRSGALERGRAGWVADLKAVRREAARAAEPASYLPALPAALKTHARVLAVLGPAFDEGLAVVATGLPAKVIPKVLARLRASGYLRAVAVEGEPPRWVFASPALGEGLSSALRPAARRSVHRRVLRFFARADGAHQSALRAWHLARSGDAEAAARAYLEAGRECFARHDLQGACTQLDQALTLSPPSARRLGAEVRFHLGLALQAAGHAEESRSHLEVLEGDPEFLPGNVLLADLHLAQARNLEVLGRHQEAMTLLAAARSVMAS